MSYKIIATDTHENCAVECFTWTRDAASGIARAKRDAVIHGMADRLTDLRAVPAEREHTGICRIRKQHGQYRVPAHDWVIAELVERDCVDWKAASEACAYYTSDRQDAINTAVLMWARYVENMRVDVHYRPVLNCNVDDYISQLKRSLDRNQK